MIYQLKHVALIQDHNSMNHCLVLASSKHFKQSTQLVMTYEKTFCFNAQAYITKPTKFFISTFYKFYELSDQSTKFLEKKKKNWAAKEDLNNNNYDKSLHLSKKTHSVLCWCTNTEVFFMQFLTCGWRTWLWIETTLLYQPF